MCATNIISGTQTEVAGGGSQMDSTGEKRGDPVKFLKDKLSDITSQLHGVSSAISVSIYLHIAHMVWVVEQWLHGLIIGYWLQGICNYWYSCIIII